MILANSFSVSHGYLIQNFSLYSFKILIAVDFLIPQPLNPFDKKSKYEYIIPVQFKSADPTKSITLENATVLNPYKTIDGNNVSTDSTNVIKAYIDYCYYIIPNNSNSIIFSGLKLSTSDEIIIGKIEKRNGLNTKDINSPDPLYKIEAKFSQTETNLSEVEKIIKANNTFN